MPDYTNDFQDFWTLYGSPKNSSKSDAFKAWNQTRKYHPKPEMLLACVQAYNIWLAAEQTKNGNGFPAKCHAATWLRGLRFEGFMDEAEAIVASGRVADGHIDAERLATTQTWIGQPGASLTDAFVAVNGGGGTAAEIGYHAIIQKWFWAASYIPGPPVEIRSPSQFHRDELEKRFGKVIRQAFGEDTVLSVAKKNGAD